MKGISLMDIGKEANAKINTNTSRKVDSIVKFNVDCIDNHISNDTESNSKNNKNNKNTNNNV